MQAAVGSPSPAAAASHDRDPLVPSDEDPSDDGARVPRARSGGAPPAADVPKARGSRDDSPTRGTRDDSPTRKHAATMMSKIWHHMPGRDKKKAGREPWTLQDYRRVVHQFLDDPNSSRAAVAGGAEVEAWRPRRASRGSPRGALSNVRPTSLRVELVKLQRTSRP